jgi:hypothetical protein
MAGKLTAVGSNFYVGTADLSGDVGAVTGVDVSRAALRVTGINAAAEERIVGRRDGSMGFMAFWNVDAGQSHATLSALPRTDVITSLVVGTPAIGSPVASMTSKLLDYAIAVGEDASIGVNVNASANGYGLEWGELLSAGKQSFGTGTVNGTSINLGAVSTLFGAAAYLHVFSVASGTATFTVQDSDDDSSFTAITGMAFTGATGATTQRLQTAAGATIRQYVRVQGTGVHGATVIALNFVRYTEAGPI